MKVTLEKVEVNRSDSFEELEYNISTENLAMFFDLLRSNLYSNPLGSIVREYASNCYDSHVEAGIPEKPFHIYLDHPTESTEGRIAFEDFGVGLSPERMKTIYTQYLSSTKRDDNNSIGGFGLGSKSMFAFADNFTIVTNYDGKSYEYLAYIDESRLGRITLLKQVETDAPNGTVISAIIPVGDPGSANKFYREINHQLRFFKNWVYYLDGEIVKTDKTQGILDGTNAKPGESFGYYFSENSCALIDQVAYPIERDILIEVVKSIGVKNAAEIVDNLPSFKFAIGDLAVTMSRESLHYTAETKETLKKVIIEYFKQVQIGVKTWAKEASKCTSLVDIMLLDSYQFLIHNRGVVSKMEYLKEAVTQIPLLQATLTNDSLEHCVNKVFPSNYADHPYEDCLVVKFRGSDIEPADYINRKSCHRYLNTLNNAFIKQTAFMATTYLYKIQLSENIEWGGNYSKLSHIFVWWQDYCIKNNIPVGLAWLCILFPSYSQWLPTGDRLLTKSIIDSKASDITHLFSMDEAKKLHKEVKVKKRKAVVKNRIAIPEEGLQTVIKYYCTNNSGVFLDSKRVVIDKGEDAEKKIKGVVNNHICIYNPTGYKMREIPKDTDKFKFIFIEETEEVLKQLQDNTFCEHIKFLTIYTNIIPVFIKIYKKYRDVIESNLTLYNEEDLKSIFPTSNLLCILDSKKDYEYNEIDNWLRHAYTNDLSSVSDRYRQNAINPTLLNFFDDNPDEKEKYDIIKTIYRLDYEYLSAFLQKENFLSLILPVKIKAMAKSRMYEGGKKAQATQVNRIFIDIRKEIDRYFDNSYHFSQVIYKYLHFDPVKLELANKWSSYDNNRDIQRLEELKEVEKVIALPDLKSIMRIDEVYDLAQLDLLKAAELANIIYSEIYKFKNK